MADFHIPSHFKPSIYTYIFLLITPCRNSKEESLTAETYSKLHSFARG